MRGSIKQRSPGSWTIRIDLGRDPVTGRRRQKTTTIRGTKKAADKELARLLMEVERGTLGASGRMTVADMAQRWLDNHVKPNLAPCTFASCDTVVRNYIIPYLGEIALDKLATPHLLAWQSKLRERDITSQTLRAYCTILRRMLNHAIKWQLISVNPMRQVTIPKRQARTDALSPDDARKVLAAVVADPYWHALLTLAITTGMRLGELRGLRWCDVDLQRQTLAVVQTIQTVHKQGTIARPPKTAGSRRQVALGADVVQLLKQHRAVQNRTRLTRGAEWQDNNLVFPARDGQPFREHTIRDRWHMLLATLQLPQIRFHDLRHTAATLMLTAGVHPKVVSERLGHSSVTMTLQTYSHVSATMQQQAAATLDTLLQNGDQSVINAPDHASDRAKLS